MPCSSQHHTTHQQKHKQIFTICWTRFVGRRTWCVFTFTSHHHFPHTEPHCSGFLKLSAAMHVSVVYLLHRHNAQTSDFISLKLFTFTINAGSLLCIFEAAVATQTTAIAPNSYDDYCDCIDDVLCGRFLLLAPSFCRRRCLILVLFNFRDRRQ